MKIFGKTLDTRILETIRAKAGKAVSRSALARRVCEILGWRRANQKPQDMTGRLILRELEKRGEIVLPASRGPVPGWKPPETGDPLWETVAGSFEGSLSGLGLLEIVPVTTKETSRVWNALFSKYHYLGKGPLCGAQIRYLARSSVLGYVGGAAFSSPAWKVSVRDLWIGWSSGTREKNLGKVVNNSRFLILPHLRVSHLASHLLGRLLRRLPGDWERAFGERPVLVETFVERERFSGTCYRAANFVEIGSTAGLGRKGRGTSVKTVLAYPFVCDFRERLREGQLPEVSSARPVFSDWTEEEFGGVDLGDARLSARCRVLAQDFYARPQASIPQACGGDRAKTKVAYRFFDHERATLEVLLETHQKATIERMKAHPVVLCVQDTTEPRGFFCTTRWRLRPTVRPWAWCRPGPGCGRRRNRRLPRRRSGDPNPKMRRASRRRTTGKASPKNGGQASGRSPGSSPFFPEPGLSAWETGRRTSTHSSGRRPRIPGARASWSGPSEIGRRPMPPPCGRASKSGPPPG